MIDIDGSERPLLDRDGDGKFKYTNGQTSILKSDPNKIRNGFLSSPNSLHRSKLKNNNCFANSFDPNSRCKSESLNADSNNRHGFLNVSKQVSETCVYVFLCNRLFLFSVDLRVGDIFTSL